MNARSIALLLALGAAALSGASIDSELLAKLIERRFPSGGCSYLLLDARTGEPLASRWPDLARPRPLGSLVKPFLALAFAEGHGFRYPEFTCTGCWLPKGHGRIGIAQAIAYSCNAYFLALAREVPASAVATVAHQFGLASPDRDDPAAWIGEGREWTNSPLDMTRAYRELIARSQQPGVRDLLDGMSISARIGTGSAVARDVLTKTGTAPCLHEKRMPGDGFAIVAFPRESPRILLLVEVHGVPGAQAAAVAGQMLGAIREGR